MSSPEEQRPDGWEDFPAGLRVLVVDDDPLCLKVVEQMLRRCNYVVTTTINGMSALEKLRDRNNHFDLVLSDVYMPDMDGFKLLEHIGLELELPVIMMSSNGETSVVLRGVTHGAVDFLIKPVRVEELRNVWQHVVRKRTQVATARESEDADDAAHSKADKKRKEHADEQKDADGASAKKARVVWSVEMHQQFVQAVNTLGIDKAVPKRILDLMNVEGLTRENVASHLQKYRLYLKRVAGVQTSGARHKGKHPLHDQPGLVNSMHALGLVSQGHPGLAQGLANPVVGLPAMGAEANSQQMALAQLQAMQLQQLQQGG